MKLIEHFVGGKIIPGSSSKKGKVYNPATGEQEKEVRLASKTDLDQAVGVAKKAFEDWSLRPSLQRARIMFKFKELIEKNSDELTKIIVSEHGKVYEDAKGSLVRGLELFTQISQVAPVQDYIDENGLVKQIINLLGLPAKMIKSDAQVQQVREQRAAAQAQAMQMQQAMQEAQMAKDAAPMVKELNRGPTE